MNKSVVVYANATDKTTPQAIEKIREHYKLESTHTGNARRDPVQPFGQLFITDRHAVHAASNVGAVYMGWAYACRVAGVK